MYYTNSFCKTLTFPVLFHVPKTILVQSTTISSGFYVLFVYLTTLSVANIIQRENGD
jgi:hypothetical protein